MKNLRYADLYLFRTKFFNDLDSVKEFISSCRLEINECYSKEDKNNLLLVKAFVISELVDKTTNLIVKNYLLVAEANFLQAVAYSTDNEELFKKSRTRIKKVDIGHFDKLLMDAYFLIKGEIFLRSHLNFRKTKSSSNSTIRSHKYLFEAKKCFSILVNRYFMGELDLKANNPQKVILGFCETISHLSRFVEPFYLLQELSKFSDNRSGSIALLRYSLLNAIKEKTCDSTNPLMLIQLDRKIDNAIKSGQIDKRNLPYLNEQKADIRNVLTKYENEHGVSKHELNEILHKALEQTNKYNNYQKFLLENHLMLNEHSLYCTCKSSIKDNLKIEAGCEHTKLQELSPYELLLDKLKVEFDNARQAFFRSTSPKGKRKAYQNTVTTSNKVKGLLINTESNDLISSFGKCFFILDKIAGGVNSAFRITTDTTIYFNSFFGRRVVKRTIDNEPINLYLIAMYSLSQDLNKESEYSQFSDYKDWRNAIEHSQLYLVNEHCDIENLKQKFPDASFFVGREEFRKKTLYLLQFTRSAIFTFTWIMRKVSIKWSA